MATSTSQPRRSGQGLLRRWRAWRQIVHLGALLMALTLSRSTLGPAERARLARQLVRAATPLLVWFSLLSALISLVIIRIVLVTAQSYGLSQYALQMVVRVLVLELIPLTAAFAVALRVTVPAAAALASMRQAGVFDALRREGIDPLRREVLPRALAGMFVVLLLAAVSSVVALVLAYLLLYGLSPWAFGSYTRLVGQVFSPAVTLIFALKTLALAAAVSLIPLGSALLDRADGAHPLPRELQGLVRLFIAMLLIEAVSLAGNYS